MGKPNPGAAEQATLVVAGTLASVAAGATILAPNTGGQRLNVTIWGTFVATLQLERSFDGGTTWVPVSRDVAGTPTTFTAPASTQVIDTESAVLYRLNMTAFTSGTASYRFSY